jgi:hypothetical protein
LPSGNQRQDERPANTLNMQSAKEKNLFRALIIGSLAVLALFASVTPAMSMETPASVGQFDVLYRSSPENDWSLYSSYDNAADAKIAADQLASTNAWEVQIVSREGAVMPGHQFKVLYRSSPENCWSLYSSYDNAADAQTAARQLASTKAWEVKVVSY